MRLNAQTVHIFRQVEDQQRRLMRCVGERVVFPKTGSRGVLLSCAYGQAEVRLDSGEVQWAHVVAVEPEDASV